MFFWGPGSDKQVSNLCWDRGETQGLLGPKHLAQAGGLVLLLGARCFGPLTCFCWPPWGPRGPENKASWGPDAWGPKNVTKCKRYDKNKAKSKASNPTKGAWGIEAWRPSQNQPPSLVFVEPSARPQDQPEISRPCRGFKQGLLGPKNLAQEAPKTEPQTP